MQIYQQRAEREKLERLISRAGFDEPISRPEQCEILKLWRTAHQVPANRALGSDRTLRLITSGWAGWVRYPGQGKRLIFLFLMPGDFIIPGLFDTECCELVSLTTLRSVDATPLLDNGASLTPRAGSMIGQSGRYYRLLLIDHLTRLAIGGTTQAVAHLLHEFYIRSIRAGACVTGRFTLPIGQRVMGSALGRSSVQINKVIRQFQAEGVLRVGYDWIEVLDAKELERHAGFSHSFVLAAGPIATLPVPDSV